MNGTPLFRIEPLGARHLREGFESGAPELDDYLVRQGGQDARRNTATVAVLVEGDSPKVLGLMRSNRKRRNVLPATPWFPRFSSAASQWIAVGRVPDMGGIC